MPKSSTSTSKARVARTTVLPTPLPSPKATALTIILSCLAGLAFSLACLTAYFVLMRRRRQKGSFALHEYLPCGNGKKRAAQTLVISKPVLQETKGSLLDKLNQHRKTTTSRPRIVQATSRPRVPRKPKPIVKPKHERRPSQALLLPSASTDAVDRETIDNKESTSIQPLPVDIPPTVSKAGPKGGVGLSLSRFYAMTDRKKSVTTQHLSTVSGPGPLIMETPAVPSFPEAFSATPNLEHGQRHESTYPATPSSIGRSFSVSSRAPPLPGRNGSDHDYPEDIMP